MRKNKTRKKLKTNDKIIRLTLFLAFLIILYIFRLFQLQILDIYNYTSKGDKVSRIGEVVKPKRGSILDRNGKPLAISQEVENLYILPATSAEKSKIAEGIRSNESEFNKLSDEEKEKYTKSSSIPVYKEEDIEKLSKILEIDQQKIYNFLDKEAEGYLYEALSKNQKKQIELLDLPYLTFINSIKRYYPNNSILATTLGFIDNDGKSNYGLENYYDTILSGKDGYREFFKAIQGTEIPYTDSKEILPENPNNIMTTIDIDLQKIIYNTIEEAFFEYLPMGINAVLMNPNNGEILALESLPGFNSNSPRNLDSNIDKLFLNKLSKDDISKYLIKRWNNNAISNQYDPGSVQKLVTTAIALESHPEINNKIYNDNGYIDLAKDVRIYNWKKIPFGDLSLEKSLVLSSNPAFVQIANDIGKKDYIDYSQVFRFGRKTGIDMPNESSGFFPTSYDISDVDFATLSYGHYASVNSIQLVSAINSIVNGGYYYKPHLLKSIVDNNDKKIFDNENNLLGRTVSSSTSEKMREFMLNTAEDYGLNENSSIKMGAKTGTAVKYNKSTIFEVVPDDENVITSIYVMFPAENPKYSLYISFDEPQKSKTSSGAPKITAQKIIDKIIAYDNEKAGKTNKNNENITIPDLKGKTIEEALLLLDDLGLKLKSNDNVGKYDIIEQQYPEENNMIGKNESVSVNIGNKAKLPDFTGSKLENIIEELKINNIKLKVNGTGKVIYKQSIEAGKVYNKDEELVLFTKE